MEHLPNPSVIIPHEKTTLLVMLTDQRLEWLGALYNQGRGSYDGERQARQAKANLNALLDHYPNGSPRDHIVAYNDKPAFPGRETETPANVVLGD